MIFFQAFAFGIVLALLPCSLSRDHREIIDPVVLYPDSDVVVIKQDKRTVGTIDTLDIFGETHLAYLLFDIVTAKDIVQMYTDNNKNPVDIKMHFTVNWAPNVGSHLSLRRVTFPNISQWDEHSLSFEMTETAKFGPEIGTTFVPKSDKFLEFDVRNEVFSWIKKCDTSRVECRYISFCFSSLDPHWLKVYSKEAYRQTYRPQIIFSEGIFPLSTPIVADTGVVRQLPERGFGQYPTLDLILYTHLAFLEFNLADLVGNIQSIHDTTRIKLRMWVEWAQAAWGTATAEVVSVNKALDENSFKWRDIEDSNLVVLSTISTEHVCTNCYVEFDLTPLLTTKVQTGQTSENRLILLPKELNHFQIRLRTEQNAWVKFASNEYHDTSKRPSIVFAQVSWEDNFKPYKAIWSTVYQIVFPPLQPIVIGVFGALVLQFIRKIIWPAVETIITFLQSKQQKKL